MHAQDILKEVVRCRLCATHLPLQPRPVLQASNQARILLIGQAPGRKAHDSNKPWNDPSGDRLRKWLGLDPAIFYDSTRIALVPMGFCYPGKGKSGDLPPRPECAPKWHPRLIASMPIGVSLLVGQYAQNYYLRDSLTLTERVKNWRRYQPNYFVLPHPSPRNNIWLKRHPWFEQEVIPQIQARVRDLLA